MPSRKTPRKRLVDGSGGSSSERPKTEVVSCICGNDTEFEMMIQCESCYVWQHGSCLGLAKEEDCPEEFYCERCHPDPHSRSQQETSSVSSSRPRRPKADRADRQCGPHRRHGYQTGSKHRLVLRGTGTPPQQDVGTDTLPTAASGNSSAAREETRNKPASIAPAEFEAPNMSAPDPPSSSSQLSLSSGTKRKIRKMLRLANHAQSIYQKETERFAALEAFAARASEVRLTSREHEFDRQLVSEITVLREVRDPALVDLEAQGTLKLAEELRRDVSEFQRRFGDGKGSKSLRQQGGQKGA